MRRPRSRRLPLRPLRPLLPVPHPRTRVAMLIADYLWRGWSAEEIVRHYPHLTLGEIHAALGAGFANGTLRPVVGRELALADAAQAYAAVMKPGAMGKIVLVP